MLWKFCWAKKRKTSKFNFPVYHFIKELYGLGSVLTINHCMKYQFGLKDIVLFHWFFFFPVPAMRSGIVKM